MHITQDLVDFTKSFFADTEPGFITIFITDDENIGYINDLIIGERKAQLNEMISIHIQRPVVFQLADGTNVNTRFYKDLSSWRAKDIQNENIIVEIFWVNDFESYSNVHVTKKYLLTCNDIATNAIEDSSCGIFDDIENNPFDADIKFAGTMNLITVSEHLVREGKIDALFIIRNCNEHSANAELRESLDAFFDNLLYSNIKVALA